MLTLEERLKICGTCSERAFEAQRGLFCGKTGEKPAFVDNCRDYRADDHEPESKAAGEEESGQRAGERKDNPEYLFFWGHTGNNPKRFLSQWYPCRFVVDGVEYSSAEQYMMAQKAALFGDDETYKKILAVSDPKEVKALGRKVKGFDEKIWNSRCDDIVRTGNLAKFSQNPELKAFLLDKTGDMTLVEASPYDRKWGIGMRECAAACDPENWHGENRLGYALTEVREMLREDGAEDTGRVPSPHDCIDLSGGDNPKSGWAIILAGGSASGKSTFIRNMSFKGRVLSTDTWGEEHMDIHNNPDNAGERPEQFATAEAIVKAGMYSRFPNRYLLNKVRNLRLDFDCPTVSPSTLSALLSNGAHRYKEKYFKQKIDECSAEMANVILDMTGKEREVNLYADYLQGKGYKVALVWVVTNRNVALLWNAQRRRSIKTSGVHAGHNGPNKWLLEGLLDGRCNMFDDVWVVFNSTESIGREMTPEEKATAMVHVEKKNGALEVGRDVAERIRRVLGPDCGSDEGYASSDWIKKFFLRCRMIKKAAAEHGLPEPDVKRLLVSFLEADKETNERRIKEFYAELGMKEPKLPQRPYECYDVLPPERVYFDSDEDYLEAVRLYPSQKARYEQAVKEWEEYNRQFEPAGIFPVGNNAQEDTGTDEVMKKPVEGTKKQSGERVSFKYDFEAHPIEKYSRKVQDIDNTIRKAEAADVTPLTAFFARAKADDATLCFYGAGGAASPATFATQLANDEGLVAMTLSPMAVMTLTPDVVKKMRFLAITASGNPVDMAAATDYLMQIAPEQVYCLTTNAIDHRNRFGRYDNKVGQMVKAYEPAHAICVNLEVHSDGFVGTNKHVGLSLLLYRSVHTEESGFVEKLLLPDVAPYEARLPEGMTMGDISDLHILFGALGRSAANDMEGRMLEAGVMPAMSTDLKNFTHGRHVFLDRHEHSTVLMLLSPRDEDFAEEMLKLIPKERPVIFIRTGRTDLLGALQLMICTFYLSIDICYPRGINAFSPGAPKWGGKLWALKLDKY